MSDNYRALWKSKKVLEKRVKQYIQIFKSIGMQFEEV